MRVEIGHSSARHHAVHLSHRDTQVTGIYCLVFNWHGSHVAHVYTHVYAGICCPSQVSSVVHQGDLCHPHVDVCHSCSLQQQNGELCLLWKYFTEIKRSSLTCEPSAQDQALMNNIYIFQGFLVPVNYFAMTTKLFLSSLSTKNIIFDMWNLSSSGCSCNATHKFFAELPLIWLVLNGWVWTWSSQLSSCKLLVIFVVCSSRRWHVWTSCGAYRPERRWRTWGSCGSTTRACCSTSSQPTSPNTSWRGTAIMR